MKYCLCTLSDDNFHVGTQVMIYSFITNNMWWNGDVVILYEKDKLSDISKDNLMKVYDNIRFIEVDIKKYISITSRWMGRYDERFQSCWLKYEIFNLKEYDKVLFMDSDILVLDDIKDMFDCKDGIVLTRASKKDPTLGKPIKKYEYERFNMGVLMVNNNVLDQNIYDDIISSTENIIFPNDTFGTYPEQDNVKILHKEEIHICNTVSM